MSGKVNVSPVAQSIPFNNATNGFTSTNVQSAIEEAKSPPSGGSGVTPPFLFSRQGATGTNSYLQVGNVFSNQAGQIIPGSNKLVKLTLTTSQFYNMAQTVQLQRRTGVSSFVDIAGAAITIPGDNATYSATLVLPTSISIGPDWEIAAYLKTGNGVQNAVLLLFVVPA